MAKGELVFLESPYEGNVANNVGYARRCMADCLNRGEYPFASHLLYTQPGILNDEIPDERTLGIESGFKWGKKADRTVVYQDLGISDGMKEGINRAIRDNRTIEYRNIYPIVDESI